MCCSDSIRRKATKTISVRPVEIIGTYPAGLKLTDQFQIVGMRLSNPGNSSICFLAISQIPIGQGIWQVPSEERFFSHVACPGCIFDIGRENRVVLLLGNSDKWELCQAISEYVNVRKKHGEPESAAKLRDLAVEQQNRGEYSAAADTMKAAVAELLGGRR